jgi:hypothetical protein
MTVVIQFPLLKCGDVLSGTKKSIVANSYGHLEIKLLFCYPEYGDSSYTRNTGKFLPV